MSRFSSENLPCETILRDLGPQAWVTSSSREIFSRIAYPFLRVSVVSEEKVDILGRPSQVCCSKRRPRRTSRLIVAPSAQREVRCHRGSETTRRSTHSRGLVPTPNLFPPCFFTRTLSATSRAIASCRSAGLVFLVDPVFQTEDGR